MKKTSQVQRKIVTYGFLTANLINKLIGTGSGYQKRLLGIDAAIVEFF